MTTLTTNKIILMLKSCGSALVCLPLQHCYSKITFVFLIFDKKMCRIAEEIKTFQLIAADVIILFILFAFIEN